MPNCFPRPTDACQQVKIYRDIASAYVESFGNVFERFLSDIIIVFSSSSQITLTNMIYRGAMTSVNEV